MAAYLSSADRGPSRGDKGSDLIAAAAEMSDVEARAFVTELQEAMARQKAAAQTRPNEESLADISLPEDWRDEKEKQKSDPANWKRRRV
jgi:hypothetical protein